MSIPRVGWVYLELDESIPGVGWGWVSTPEVCRITNSSKSLPSYDHSKEGAAAETKILKNIARFSPGYLKL